MRYRCILLCFVSAAGDALEEDLWALGKQARMAAAAAETAAARAEGARVALETELSTVKQREKEKVRPAQNSLAAVGPVAALAEPVCC